MYIQLFRGPGSVPLPSLEGVPQSGGVGLGRRRPGATHPGLRPPLPRGDFRMPSPLIFGLCETVGPSARHDIARPLLGNMFPEQQATAAFLCSRAACSRLCD